MKDEGELIFEDFNEGNWQQFWKLSNKVLQSDYPASLFQELLDGLEKQHLVVVSKGVSSGSHVIAGIKAYSIVSPTKSMILPIGTYIETLVVCEDYRKRGIGTHLLQLVEQESKNCFINKVILHTPVNNTSVIRWYKSNGFEVVEVINNYYSTTKLNSIYSLDAVLLEKQLL